MTSEWLVKYSEFRTGPQEIMLNWDNLFKEPVSCIFIHVTAMQVSAVITAIIQYLWLGKRKQWPKNYQVRLKN